MRRYTRLVCLAAILAGAAQADTLILKDGRTIQGLYSGGTRSSVRMEVNGSFEMFPIEDVRTIHLGDGTPAPAKTAAPAENVETRPSKSQPVKPAEPKSAPKPAPTTTPAPQAAAASTPVTPDTPAASGVVEVPAGTSLLVRTVDELNAGEHTAGQRFSATLEADVYVGDRLVLPRSSRVYGRLVESDKSKKTMTLELTDVDSARGLVKIATDTVHTGSTEVTRSEGGRASKSAAESTVSTAGSVAGNKDIGSIAGNVVGAGLTPLTSKKRPVLPKGTLVEFRLKDAFAAAPLEDSRRRR